MRFRIKKWIHRIKTAHAPTWLVMVALALGAFVFTFAVCAAVISAVAGDSAVAGLLVCCVVIAGWLAWALHDSVMKDKPGLGGSIGLTGLAFGSLLALYQHPLDMFTQLPSVTAWQVICLGLGVAAGIVSMEVARTSEQPRKDVVEQAPDYA